MPSKKSKPDKYKNEIIFEGIPLRVHKPVLKWVGGKQNLLTNVLGKFPKKMKNYHEPFLGGGSVLIGILTLIHKNKIEVEDSIYAYDLNPYLIALYHNIQQFPEEVYQELQKLKTKINSISTIKDTDKVVRKNIKKKIKAITEENSQETQEMFYYWCRKLYNEMSIEEKKSIQGSAYFLFLNKTCFRGLYRVNNQDFNVPYGNYKKPEILSLQQIREVSKLLQPVIFQCLSFQNSLETVGQDDFVYLDPPYVPEDESSFVKYTKEGFSKELHEELFSKVKKMENKFLMSNSKVDLVTNAFLEEEYNVDTIECRRAINSKNPESTTQEVLIYN